MVGRAGRYMSMAKGPTAESRPSTSAAAGTRCIIDNHNYGRYQDFRFQPTAR
jgi:hypothetical protein